jgi:7-cyano-7-deazaguanine synthase
MQLSPPKSLAVLVSGGLDSCILAAHYLQQGFHVHPIYIETDLHWHQHEFESLNRFLIAIATPRLKQLVVLQMPLADLYREHWSVSGRDVPDAQSPDEAVFLPGRNALLLVKAMVWCQLQGVTQLALAPLGTSPFHDARDPFFNNFQAALNCGDLPNVEILRPFHGMTKQQVMELGRPFPLQFSFSCISPQFGLHCGVCNKCAERRAAFAAISLKDPTEYAVLECSKGVISASHRSKTESQVKCDKLL